MTTLVVGGVLKFVGEIQQLVWKRSQKNNEGVILNCISLSIYPLHFSTFCPIQKQQKTLRNCRYLVKTIVAVDLIFNKLIFFESFIIFLEPAIKSNYRNIWFWKVIIILVMTTEVLLFDVFSEKDPPINAVELLFWTI